MIGLSGHNRLRLFTDPGGYADLNFTRGSVTDLWLFFCYDQMEKVIKTSPIRKQEAILMKAMNVQSISCLAILIVFVAVSNIRAADWIFYGETRSGHLYYEKTDIKINGNIARVRTMAILNDDGKIELYSALRKAGKSPGNSDLLSYTIALEEYDCVNKKLRLSSMTIHTEKGSTVHSSLIKNDEWDDIIPGTNSDILGKIVCSGSRQ